MTTEALANLNIFEGIRQDLKNECKEIKAVFIDLRKDSKQHLLLEKLENIGLRELYLSLLKTVANYFLQNKMTLNK